MDWLEVDLANCPIVAAVDALGDRWSVLILREIFNGVGRFDDIVGHLGISRTTLSDRLRRLVELGLVERRQYKQAASRARPEYVLTEACIGDADFAKLLMALAAWGRQRPGAGEVLAVVRPTANRRVGLALVDEETGEIVDGEGLRMRPGADMRLRSAPAPRRPTVTPKAVHSEGRRRA